MMNASKLSVVAAVAALAGCTCCGPKGESLLAMVRFRNIKVRKL